MGTKLKPGHGFWLCHLFSNCMTREIHFQRLNIFASFSPNRWRVWSALQIIPVYARRLKENKRRRRRRKEILGWQIRKKGMITFKCNEIQFTNINQPITLQKSNHSFPAISLMMPFKSLRWKLVWRSHTKSGLLSWTCILFWKATNYYKNSCIK